MNSTTIRLFSSALIGLQAYEVEIEVDIQKGLPGIHIIGLPDISVKESKDRIRSAISNSDYDFPLKKIIVNLAPAGMKKLGTHLDLAIALGIIFKEYEINSPDFKDSFFIGELSLDGRLRPVNGLLSIGLMLKKKFNSNLKFFVSYENRNELALIPGIDIYPIKNLKEAFELFQSGLNKKPYQMEKGLFKDGFYINTKKTPSKEEESREELDFEQVKGHYKIKRAIEVACAGGHHILMIGSPGSGKSMLAKRSLGILPSFSKEEFIETIEIYSAAKLLTQSDIFSIQRPFREPHYSASSVAILGGGKKASPGELSLAHNGILFLDEFPEFRRDIIEGLRIPMEDGKIEISRADYVVHYPTRFLLIAAMNPCPCGYYSHPKIACRCKKWEIQKYINKISGPILDRIDIQIHIPFIDYKEIFQEKKEEPSFEKRKRVIAARKVQLLRYKKNPPYINAWMKPNDIKRHIKLTEDLKDFLKKALENLNLSLRSYDKILRISRTIADLEGRKSVEKKDILEALQYRIKNGIAGIRVE